MAHFPIERKCQRERSKPCPGPAAFHVLINPLDDGREGMFIPNCEGCKIGRNIYLCGRRLGIFFAAILEFGDPVVGVLTQWLLLGAKKNLPKKHKLSRSQAGDIVLCLLLSSVSFIFFFFSSGLMGTLPNKRAVCSYSPFLFSKHFCRAHLGPERGILVCKDASS